MKPSKAGKNNHLQPGPFILYEEHETMAFGHTALIHYGRMWGSASSIAGGEDLVNKVEIAPHPFVHPKGTI
jgi:hypothetical protein